MKIKIGDTIYRVEEKQVIRNWFSRILMLFVGGEASYYGGVCLGQINYLNKRIQIKKNQQAKKHTLYHEIAHGIMFELEKKYSCGNLRNNEDFINGMANVLMKTFNIKKIK